MNLEMLEKSGNIIFKCLSGSRCYHTHLETSDSDYRGCFALPQEEFLGLNEPITQVSDSKQDITFYELKKFFQLAETVSPNMIELLWVPDDCIEIWSPQMQTIKDNRNLFLSRKAKSSFSGYAFSQISKSKGANKLVNNPKPKERPTRDQFCWYIPMGKYTELYKLDAPARPLNLADSKLNLSKYHVVKLEHVENTYRLYYYGNKAKGVFRDGNLVCEPIPLEDENILFSGLLIYNEKAYEAECKDWKNYWDWMKNRNEARWVDQEGGKADFDAKNLMHAMRLLWSGISIMEGNGPIVRFEGWKLQTLKDIRACKYKHKEILEMAQTQMAYLDSIVDKSPLPHSVDHAKIDALYREIRGMRK